MYTIKEFEKAVLAIQKKVQGLSNEELYGDSFVVDFYSDSETSGLYETIKDYFMVYEYEKRLIEIGFLKEELKPLNLEYRIWMKFKTPIYNKLHDINLEGQMVSCVYDGKEFGYFGVHSQDFDINTTLMHDIKFTVDEDGNKIKTSLI